MRNVEAATPRKRLGQFFSGPAVGRLLAALADAPAAETILDPMSGTADLLQACLDIGARPSLLAGIEVDPTAHRTASRRLPQADIILGDAFDVKTLSRLPRLDWDLVVGNPPFVRYQETSQAVGSTADALVTRRRLIEALGDLPSAQGKAGPTLLRAAQTYSGQSDLAVPACLLSMGLVREGGRLALVLPAAFLSRDYAEPVRACLTELFVVEQVLEDAGTSWFPDALVRTLLLVARRAAGTSTTVKYTLGSSAAAAQSLVGRLYPNAAQPELAFVAGLSRESLHGLSPGAFVLETTAAPEGQTCLKALGVEVGQGLRTGANDFFYVRTLEGGRVRTSAALGETVLRLPPRLIRSALRDQKALTSDPDAWGVLDLRTVTLPEDLPKAGSPTAYSLMPPDLAAHVRRAAGTLSGKPGRQSLIPDLSAVRSNVRAARGDRPARFWYMLPDFKPRHLPDLVLPRVVYGRPRAQLMPRQGQLADANFVTFRSSARIPAEALLALLNSAFCWNAFEAQGTVLGGGALKLESAVVKRVFIPLLTEKQIEGLRRIGARRRNEDAVGPWLDADEILIGDRVRISLTLKAARERLRARSPSAAIESEHG